MIDTIAYRELRDPAVPMQSDIDSELIYSTVRHLQPKNVLEIGFRYGFSLGLIIEAIDGSAEITTCDIEHSNLKNFLELYNIHLKNKTLRAVTNDSRFLQDSRYDLIHVDGNHDYEFVKSDLEYAVRNLDGVLLVDDYHYEDVRTAIKDVLVPAGFKMINKGFVQTVWSR